MISPCVTSLPLTLNCAPKNEPLRCERSPFTSLAPSFKGRCSNKSHTHTHRESLGPGGQVVVRQEMGLAGGGSTPSAAAASALTPPPLGGGGVWESGLALIAHCDRERGRSSPWWQALLPPPAGASPPVVVELGSGTGVVGLALGALLGRSKVVLTDLPAYLPLLRRNASLNASLLRPAPSPARCRCSFFW